MMKRAVFIIAMLLANMSIMAHAVVPHHHTCELLSTIVHLFNMVDDKGSHAIPIHHHHSDKPTECQLEGSYTAPRIQNEEQSLVPDNTAHDRLFPFSTVCIDLSYRVRYSPQQQRFQLRPYAADAFPDYVAACIGLRAPPYA